MGPKAKKDANSQPVAMPITLRQLVNARDTMAIAKLSEVAPPGRIAYLIGHKCLAPIMRELEAFEKQRLALCDKYGHKDEKTNQYNFDSPEQRAEFDSDLNALMDTEVNLEVTPVALSAVAGLHIPAVVFMELGFLFTDP